MGPDQSMGPGGLATPETGGRACGRPPNKLAAASGPGGRWGSEVFGWRALCPPRAVFVIGFVSCHILPNSLMFSPMFTANSDAE